MADLPDNDPFMIFAASCERVARLQEQRPTVTPAFAASMYRGLAMLAEMTARRIAALEYATEGDDNGG